MQLQNKIAYISIFAASAISIFTIESIIPKPMPGIRLGLSNIFILLALIHYGYKEALLIGILKSVVGSLILGNLLSPSFLFSIGGTIISITVMIIAIRYIKSISLVGISILGAEFHIITQVMLATNLFLPEASFRYLLPPLAFLSLISGALTGIITYWLYIKTEKKIETAKSS